MTSKTDEANRLLPQDDSTNKSQNNSMSVIPDHEQQQQTSYNTTGGSKVNSNDEIDNMNDNNNNNTSDAIESPNKKPDEPIDGSYGYVMAFLVLCVQFSIFGISNSYPSFSGEMKKDDSLGNPSSSDVSLPNAVMNGLAPIVSIFAGALTDSIGPRPVLMGATLSMALGSFLGSFAHSTTALVFLYGVPCGVGMASLTSPSAVALTSWMKEKLPTAIGIGYAGSGIGSALVVAAAGLLAESDLGWRASFRILAAFALFGFTASLFIRVRRGHVVKKKLNINGKWGEVGWFLKKLFTSKVFIWMFIAAAFFSFSMFSIFYIVVPYATKFGSIDQFSPYSSYSVISVAAASTLYTYLGAARGITSMFAGALATKTDPTYVYALGTTFCAICCCFWAVSTEYWHLAIICTVLGASIACVFASFPAMAARCFAGPHCGLGVGITMCGYSVGGFAGPPTILAITSASDNNFTSAFVLMSWCCIVAAFIVLFILRGDIVQQHFATEEGLATAEENDYEFVFSPSSIVKGSFSGAAYAEIEDGDDNNDGVPEK